MKNLTKVLSSSLKKIAKSTDHISGDKIAFSLWALRSCWLELAHPHQFRVQSIPRHNYTLFLLCELYEDRAITAEKYYFVPRIELKTCSNKCGIFGVAMSRLSWSKSTSIFYVIVNWLLFASMWFFLGLHTYQKKKNDKRKSLSIHHKFYVIDKTRHANSVMLVKIVARSEYGLTFSDFVGFKCEYVRMGNGSHRH